MTTPRSGWPLPLTDRLGRRSLAASLGGHGLALLILLYGPLLAELVDLLPRSQVEDSQPEADAAPAVQTRVVYRQLGGVPTLPATLPTLPQPADPATDTTSQPLQPRLFDRSATGTGSGDTGGDGSRIDLPPLPPMVAAAIPSARQPAGGGDPLVPEQQRREQEANYFLMGMLLRQYRNHWRPLWGQRLPRRTVYLWITHRASRVTSARFANGSSTGVPELDHAVINWLDAQNEIDLPDLSGSLSPLLMSIDFYQAHRE